MPPGQASDELASSPPETFLRGGAAADNSLSPGYQRAPRQPQRQGASKMPELGGKQAQMVGKMRADKAVDAHIFTYCRQPPREYPIGTGFALIRDAARASGGSAWR